MSFFQGIVLKPNPVKGQIFLALFVHSCRIPRTPRKSVRPPRVIATRVRGYRPCSARAWNVPVTDPCSSNISSTTNPIRLLLN